MIDFSIITMIDFSIITMINFAQIDMVIYNIFTKTLDLFALFFTIQYKVYITKIVMVA
jgi:hypothetical protein